MAGAKPVPGSRLRGWCLELPLAEETFPFGPEHSVFKVARKLFAIAALEAEPPLTVSLKCEPEIAVGLRSAHAAVAPGYHLNKRHWNTVTLDGSLPETMVIALIEDSYDLVVDGLPKRDREKLRHPSSR